MVGDTTHTERCSELTTITGVQTPQPLQLEIVDNCKKFHLVAKGETCAAIAAKYKIPIAKIVEWNPSVQDGCSFLWADAWACIMALDYVPGGDSPAPSPTKPSNR